MSKTNEELDELLDQVDMEDFLVFEGVNYRVTRGRSGVQLNLKECPRCGGQDWKVYINADTGLGSCFHGACADHPGFNKYSFINHLSGKSFSVTMQTLRRYAKSLGWRPKERAERPQDEAPSSIDFPASTPLPINGRNLKYLTDRGFSPELTSYFEWRFSKSGTYSYTLMGQAKKQDWANRVVIPVRNLDGQLVTFQGRSTDKSAFQKYLFPPGLPGAGRYLYNGHNAVGCEEIVMGEGAFDVAAIKKAFDEDPTFKGIGVIGTFGKHLSMAESGAENDQLSDLKKLAAAGMKTITLMWDGEPAAIKQAIKVGLELRTYGFKTRLATLPLNKDPNEVDPEVVRQAFVKAVELSPLVAAKLLTRYTFERA